MAKETSFSHPPRGHVGILLYCPAEDKWYVAASDSAGYQIVKVVTSTLPTGAATETTLASVLTALQKIDDLQGALDSVGTDELDVNVEASVLPTGASTEASLAEVSARLGDETNPATGSVNKQLLNILTELQAVLKTADLNIEAGSKDLQVDVKSAPATDIQVHGWDGAAWEKISSVGDPGPALKVAVGVGGNIAQTANCSGDDVGTNTKLLYTAAFLYGFDGTNWDRLRCGADGLEVDVKAMPTTTVQAAGGDKIFSFESIVEEEIANTNLAAGTNSISGTAIASGKVAKITLVSMRYTGTVPTQMYVRFVGLASDVVPILQTSPASGQWYVWNGEVYLQGDDYVNVVVDGATAGDDVHVRYAGVQMDAP